MKERNRTATWPTFSLRKTIEFNCRKTKRIKLLSHLEFSKQQIQELLLLLIITTYKGFKILKSLKSFFSSSPFSRKGEIWREGERERERVCKSLDSKPLGEKTGSWSLFPATIWEDSQRNPMKLKQIGSKSNKPNRTKPRDQCWGRGGEKKPEIPNQKHCARSIPWAYASCFLNIHFGSKLQFFLV